MEPHQEMAPAGARAKRRAAAASRDVAMLVATWILLAVGAPVPGSAEPAALRWGESKTPAGTGAPELRFGHAMVYEPAGDRLIVFGGCNGRWPLHDVWARQLHGDTTWRPIQPAGESPPGRMGATIVYEPTPPRLVVFGGWGWDQRHQINYNDCWALELGDSLAWKRLNPSGKIPPAPRNHHSAIYDPRRDRMLVFGGGKNEVWALTLDAEPSWSKVAVPGPSPPPLEGHSAVYDAKRDRMLVFGGAAGNSSPLMKLTGGPPTRTWSDVWALSLGESPTWTKLAALGEPPSPRYHHVAVMDTVADRMLVFSGGHSRGGPVADLWELSLAGQTAWSQISVAGPEPAARMSHAAAYDPRRGRVWVYGGARNGGFEGMHSALGDLWWLAVGGTADGADSTESRH